MLSEELLGELRSEYGQSDCDLIITDSNAANKKRKLEEKLLKDKKPIAEVKNIVKKISKKKQKRIEQIQKRKERETRQGDFLKTIRSHELSSKQQDLIVSSRALNQQLTTKQLLSHLLKKERAGVALSNEEKDILYKSRELPDDIPEFDQSLLVMPTDLVVAHSTLEVNRNAERMDDDDTTPFFSFSEILKGNVPEESANTNPSQSLTGDSTLEMELETELTNNSSEEASRWHRLLERKSVRRLPLRKPITQGSRIVKYNLKQDIPETISDEDQKLPEVQQSSKKSVGELMLEKFKSLKNKSVPNDEKVKEFELIDPGNQIEETKPLKSYDEIKLPVNALGQIQLVDGAKASVENIKLRKYISIKRTPEITKARINLPVCQMEQEILEAVNDNDVVILCGETGSGKSTQVPQFLYEYGYAEHGLIGIAQPRRVAVISTAERVHFEMQEGCDGINKNSKTGGSKPRIVGYQIRYDAHTITSQTKIKFLTDGILLREVSSDILLRNYSVILLDEAHERNINTDILLGMLSRAIPLRKKIALEEIAKYHSLSLEERQLYAKPLQPLKLVIMSATIRVEDFQNSVLFPVKLPPILNVPSRQYPVVTHFAKRTEMKHYLKETFRKIIQIHTKLPAGGILVFLTGKQEILYMCRKLAAYFRKKQRKFEKDTGSKKRKFSSSEENSNLFEDDKTELEDGREAVLEVFNDEQAEIQGEFGDDLGENSHELSDEDEDEEYEGESENDDISVSDPLHKNFTFAAETNPTQPLVSSFISERASTESTGDDSVKQKMLAQLLGKDFHATQKEEPQKSDNSIAATAAQTEGLPTEPEETQLKPVIFPLHAMMSPKLQERVFKPIPEGHRLIVIATNVAETSITIPNITYVVDCGRCKEKVVVSESNGSAGITKYEVNWISKASADQRQGRAGRTGPGHCYRLYSANFFHQHMKSFVPPEITLSPLEDVVLQMASLGINQITSFPFPTNPPKKLILNAIKFLEFLGAMISSKSRETVGIPNYLSFMNQPLQPKTEEITIGELSEIGKLMSIFPVHPRFSKIIISTLFGLKNVFSKRNEMKKKEILESQVRVIGFVLTLVSALAERSIFNFDRIKDKHQSIDNENDSSEEEDADEDEKIADQKEKEKGKQLYFHSCGDALAQLRGTGAFIFTVQSLSQQLPDISNSVSATPSSFKITKSLFQKVSNTFGTELKSFCLQFNLQEHSLQRVIDLRNQLQVLTESMLTKVSSSFVFSNEVSEMKTLLQELHFPSPVAPPTLQEEIIIRQLLLTGYCDQIAKKLPVGAVKAGNKRKRFTAYSTCNPLFYTKEMIVQQQQLKQQFPNSYQQKNEDSKSQSTIVPIYIHPHSNLFPNNPLQSLPEYIIYNSIIMNTAKTAYYMTNVTVIDEKWIVNIAKDSPLLTYGEILSSPAPYYDEKQDEIYCSVTPKYGNPSVTQLWELSTVSRPMIEVLNKKKYSSAEGDNSQMPLGYRKGDEIYRLFLLSILCFFFLLLFVILGGLQSSFWKECFSII
jgi:HrpA-like RNA helicase